MLLDWLVWISIQQGNEEFMEFDRGKFKLSPLVIVSVIAVGTFVIWFFIHPRFETNDDSAMMYMLAGYYTGNPEIMAYNINIGYAAIVSGMYRIFPVIPWYTVINLGLQLISVIIIGYIFFSFERKKHLFIWSIAIAYACLYMMAYLYPMIALQYTMTSALCGGASVLIVLNINKCTDKTKNIFSIICFAIMLFFAANIRMQIGYIVAAVVTYSVIAECYVEGRNVRKTAYIVIGVMIIICSVILNSVYSRKEGWDEYASLNKVRAEFMDYEHLTYEDAPEVYETIGWNENIVNFLHGYCFMMPNTNKETFSYLNSQYEEWNQDNFNIIAKLKSMVKEFLSSALNLLTAIAWFIVLMAISFTEIGKDNSKSRKWILISWGYYLIFCCLIVYLLWIGRMPVRVYYMCLILTLTPGIYTILCYLSLEKLPKGAKIIVVMTGILIALISGGNLKSEIGGRKVSYERSNSRYDYVISNENNFYVYDVSMTEALDPFKTFTDLNKAPVNVMFWGGWLYESPLFYRQLNANGLKELKFENMLDDNKYFIGSYTYMKMVDDYYKEKYDGVVAEVTYECDDFIVYCFRYED